MVISSLQPAVTSTADATYTYDNNGSLISKANAAGTTTYTFNEENQLTHGDASKRTNR